MSHYRGGGAAALPQGGTAGRAERSLGAALRAARGSAAAALPSGGPWGSGAALPGGKGDLGPPVPLCCAAGIKEGRPGESCNDSKLVKELSRLCVKTRFSLSNWKTIF